MLSTEAEHEDDKSSTGKKKIEEEKRQRDHILQLNQILAQQVMERSKLVAGIKEWNFFLIFVASTNTYLELLVYKIPPKRGTLVK